MRQYIAWHFLINVPDFLVSFMTVYCSLLRLFFHLLSQIEVTDRRTKCSSSLSYTQIKINRILVFIVLVVHCFIRILPIMRRIFSVYSNQDYRLQDYRLQDYIVLCIAQCPGAAPPRPAPAKVTTVLAYPPLTARVQCLRIGVSDKTSLFFLL